MDDMQVTGNRFVFDKRPDASLARLERDNAGDAMCVLCIVKHNGSITLWVFCKRVVVVVVVVVVW